MPEDTGVMESRIESTIDSLQIGDVCCEEFYGLYLDAVVSLTKEQGWHFTVAIDSKVENDRIGLLLVAIPFNFCPMCGKEMRYE